MQVSLPVGTELADGRYRLEDRLGQGGTGAVYRALDRQHERQVAIKLLDPARSRSGHLLKFKREFRATGRLDHPNCVKVYELGCHGDQWFFTMEYLAGGCLPKSRMPAGVVAQVALQMLAALDHLHAKQIIHCDLKPQNILKAGGTDAMPRVKLADFGISRAGHLGEVAEGRFVEGSFPYLSPEQAAGAPLDPRSDLYSLGVNLYLFLCGKLPLMPAPNAPASAWLKLHRDTIPPPLLQVAPDVPQPLASVVMELLAKQPSARPPSAAAVFDRIEAWAQADGVALPQVGQLQRQGMLVTPALVGRQAELGHGRAWVEDNLLGQTQTPGALFVTGSAGVGKSRLIIALSEAARKRGAWVHTASCRAEPGMAYEPLSRLFRVIFDVLPPGVVAASSSAAPISASVDGDGATISMVAPVAQPAGLDDTAEPASLGMEAAHGGQWDFLQRSAEALLHCASRKPTVVVLEDLQWADTSTLEIIRYWLRALSQARARGEVVRLGLLLSHRPAPDSEALATLYQTAEQARAMASIALQPLTEDCAAQMAASVLMRPLDAQLQQFVNKLVARGDASPLFIRQALQLLVSSGQLVLRDQGWDLDAVDVSRLPIGVRAAVGERAARLSGETQQVLAIASVVGRGFRTGTLLDASALEEGVLLDCLDEAIRTGFVIDDPRHAGRYLFEHDRLRESVYQALEPGTRERLHRSVAASVEQHRKHDPAAAAEIAHHYGACGELEKAYAYGVRAAQWAKQAFAFERAAELYTQALAWAEQSGLPIEATLHEEQGDACLEAGQYAAAQASFERRLETVQGGTERAELQRKAAVVAFRQGHTARACKLLETVMRKLGFGIPRTRLGIVLRFIGGMLHTAWRAKIRFRGARLFSGRRKSRARVAAAVCRQLAEAYFFIDGRRSMYFNTRALRIAERLGDGAELAAAASTVGMMLGAFGQLKVSQRCFERARRAAADHPLARGICLMMEGLYHCYKADVQQASSCFTKSAELYAKAHEPMGLRQVWTMHAQALCQIGQLDAADRYATKVWELAESLDDDRGRGWARMVQGMVATRRGKPAEAITLLGQAVHFSVLGTDIMHQVSAGARLALVMGLEGDIEAALALAERTVINCVEQRVMHTTNVAECVFFWLSALAQVASGQPDPELARRARWVQRHRRSFAAVTRLVYPMYLCGISGLQLIKGQEEKAKLTANEAVELAESSGQWGELRDMHLVLARLFAQDSATAAHHAAAAKRLEAQINAPDAETAGSGRRGAVPHKA